MAVVLMLNAYNFNGHESERCDRIHDVAPLTALLSVAVKAVNLMAGLKVCCNILTKFENNL